MVWTNVKEPSDSALDEVLGRFSGLPGGVGERIRDLAGRLRDDPDDDEISLGSVETLCRFLTSYRVQSPGIVADGDGQLMVEWLDATVGRLGMDFRSDGRVHFALVGGTEAGHPGRSRLSGAGSLEQAVQAVRATTGGFPFL